MLSSMSNRPIRARRGPSAETAPTAEFYRQLADLAPQMLWSARADGTTDFFNGRVFEYTGLSQKELEGWGWRKVVHPDDWERCLARWTKAFKRAQPYEVEYRLRRHDGKYLWHLSAAMPHREGGRVVRWIGSCTEIENQKRAERLLETARAALATLVASGVQEQQERERERFRAFVDSVPGIAWIKDSKLRYVWTSASYERIFGKSLDSMLGRDDFAVWPEAMAAQFRANDEKVLRVNGAVKDVANTPLPGGSAARWMAVKFPLPDESGALGVAGIAFDITESSGDNAADERDDSPLARLSGRELQVMHLMVEGCSSAEIGARLTLSPKSVDTYRSRLMAKLKIKNLPTLVKFALRYGLTAKR